MLQRLGLIFVTRNIFPWPCICCISPNISHCLLASGTLEHLEHHWVSLCQVPGIEEQLPRKVFFFWCSNLHSEMQSIWKISLGTWLVLLGDYPSITHCLSQRPDGGAEMGRFHERNSFPGWFHPSPPRSSNISLKRCVVSDCPCRPAPSHVATRSSFITDKEETVSHLVVLWCCRPPPTKASQDTLGFLSCCHLDHAVIIKDIRCGHLSGLIASQRTRSTDLDLLVSWPSAEVAAASGAG